MPQSKDLFDESTMSFGEHLEVLRAHLIKAMFGLVIGVVVTLFFGRHLVAVIRKPIDDALLEYGREEVEIEEDLPDYGVWDYLSGRASREIAKIREEREKELEAEREAASRGLLTLSIDAGDLRRALAEADPERSVPLEAPPEEGDGNEEGEQPKVVKLMVRSPLLSKLQKQVEQVEREQHKPITITVQEAFLTFLKVSLIGGLVLSSPWVFYQLWLFVAAGLYPHERHYVYIYLPMSLTLFLGGALFCFFVVFPFVLRFLLGFNAWLNVFPQIRLSEWISFAVMLPLMFGLSFQLPLVMLFLERISVFEVADYREKRRMAILVIAIVSMFMTPADPASMMLMMLPLIGLYELGIYLCRFRASKSPFDDAEPAPT